MFSTKPETTSLSQQLSLGLELATRFTWQDFYATDHVLLSALKDFQTNDEFLFYLYGSSNCGKTHLLQAVYQDALSNNISTLYVSLRECRDYTETLLDNLENLSLVCIDDIDAVANLDEWEEKLFVLFNELKQNGGKLLVASSSVAANSGWQLADLCSRLQSGLTYKLQPLSETEMLKALAHRANLIGLELNNEALHFLIKRVQRNMQSLMHILDQLDQASMIEQRRLTIPFIKQVLKL